MCAFDLKYGDITVPGIDEDEPIFIMRARDLLSVGVLDEYIYFADDHGLTSVADGVNKVREQFVAWQAENDTKLPG